jgi:cephalosporin hydroxylase
MGFRRKIKALAGMALRIRPTHLRLLHRIINMPEETVRAVLESNRQMQSPGKAALIDPVLTSQLGDAANQYHLWYYNTGVWQDIRFLGNRIYKSVADLWSYQEILFNLKPRLVVEFGAHLGGSTLFFSWILRMIRPDSHVFSVDITLAPIPAEIRDNPHMEFMESSSTDPKVYARIAELRRRYPGPVFFILDSDHVKAHVLGELRALRAVTQQGDYVVVEDSNINGHPVLPGWGEGPYEAIEAYEREYPDDYVLDRGREAKFGFTWAPKGFLIRQ